MAMAGSAVASRRQSAGAGAAHAAGRLGWKGFKRLGYHLSQESGRLRNHKGSAEELRVQGRGLVRLVSRQSTLAVEMPVPGPGHHDCHAMQSEQSPRSRAPSPEWAAKAGVTLHGQERQDALRTWDLCLVILGSQPVPCSRLCSSRRAAPAL